MQSLILVPTHELAVQVIRQIERLSENSDIKLKAATIIGNVNIDRQIEKLKEKPHIIVGTPGRILELIKKKKISAHTVKTIILDEADRLMDRNNIEPVKAVIKSTLKERQVLAFSATIPKEAEMNAKALMKEALVIRGKEKAESDKPEFFLYLFQTLLSNPCF
jgi:superfamily II DNA/RNA helicase